MSIKVDNKFFHLAFTFVEGCYLLITVGSIDWPTGVVVALLSAGTSVIQFRITPCTTSYLALFTQFIAELVYITAGLMIYFAHIAPHAKSNVGALREVFAAAGMILLGLITLRVVRVVLAYFWRK